MNIAIQPQPAKGPESGATLPTPDQLYQLRDTASRNGTTNEYDQYVGLLGSNESTRKMYADAGVDIAVMPFARPDRSNTVMNYATLQGDDPFDADFGGLLGGNMIIVPPDPPAERLRGGPLPAPTVQPIPGPSRPPKVLPFTLMGEDGHLGAYIPPDLRAAMGSLPDDFPIEQAFADLMNADRGALPDDDFGRGLSAVLADATRAQESQVDPEHAFGRAVAAPDGVWADRFGRSIQQLGRTAKMQLGLGYGDPDAESLVKYAGPMGAQLNAAGTFLTGVGRWLRETGEAQGSNVGATEQVGRQLPGPRGTNVGRLQAQEYRAMLHDLRRKGQVGYSEGEINALPEAQLITQIERMQVLAANFRREAVVQSGQMWADLAVTLPGMVTGSNLLAARLAIPRLVASRLGPVADQSFRLALRMGGEGAIGGVSGFAVSDGPARMANAKDWAIGGAVVPLLGFGWRGGVNAATGGKYLSFDNVRFKGRVASRLKADGVHPGFADVVAESFDDWHQKNWMTFGNGNLEQAAMTPHVLDRVAQKAVREAMLPNASDAAVKEATDALMQLGKIRDEAVKAEEAFRKAVAEGITILDPEIKLSATAGIPDPKALREAFQTLVGSGKTIDRKKYQALLKYLETAEERLPQMRDQLAAINAFLRGEAEGVDALKAMAAELSQAGLLTNKKAISLLKQQLVTFNASTKAFRQNLNKGHQKALQQARDVMTEATAALEKETPEVQKWVRNDPFEKFDALETEYTLTMDAAVPPEARPIALQHRTNVKTHREAKTAVTRLEVALGRAEDDLERSIKKQQERLTGQIDEVQGRIDTFGDPDARAARVDQVIDADVEYLGAQRDLSIRQAMESTQAELNKQDGIFKRAKTSDAVAAVNDAKARILRERKQWLEWINSRYDEELELRMSDAHRAEVERGVTEELAGLSDRKVDDLLTRRRLVERDLADAVANKNKPIITQLRRDLANVDRELGKVPGDFTELVKNRARLRSEALDGAQRMREAHGQRVDRLWQDLDVASQVERAAADDMMATLESLKRYGDPDQLSKTAAKIEANYRPRLDKLEAQATKELTSPEAVMPKGLSPERAKELRTNWQAAKWTSDEIRRASEESLRLGNETIQAAQDDLLRAVTNDLKAAESVAARFDEMVPGARTQADKTAVSRLDALLKQNMPETGGLTSYQHVNAADAGLPLSHDAVPANIRGSLLGRMQKMNRELVDIGLGYAPDARIGRRRPRIALWLAERIAGVKVGTYKSLTDVPIGVARYMVDHHETVFSQAVRRAMKANGARAVNEAANILAQMKSGFADMTTADAIVALTPEAITAIERASFLAPGTLTERSLTQMKASTLKVLEEVYGLKPGTLTKQRKRLTVDALQALERKHGLPEGALTTASGRMKLLQGVAARQELAIREFRAAQYRGKLAKLDDPEFAAVYAARHAHSFHPGRLMRVAAEMGLPMDDVLNPGPTRTAVVVKLVRDMMEASRTGMKGPDGAKLGAISRIAEHQMREPIAARYLLHNFMLLDEVLGGYGLNITPLLDDFRRSVVREKALNEATIDGVSDFFNKVSSLYPKDGVDDEMRSEINKLVTHYRLAKSNPGDAKYTMEEVLAAADHYKLDREILDQAAAAGDEAYEAYHKFLRDAGYDIGEIEGYSSKIQTQLPEPPAPKSRMARIYKKQTDWWRKKRGDEELDLREYDSLVLLSKYHEAVKREHILGDAIRHAARIEQTLRETLASANMESPRILRTFSDVTNYAQGINRKSIMPGLRWLYKGASRLNALRLSGPKTALKQFADPFVVMGTLSPVDKRWGEYQKIVSQNVGRHSMSDPKWKRIADYLDFDGIGGGEYKVWDQIGMQHHELMTSARAGQAIEKESWMDRKLIRGAMAMMHAADRSGRLASAGLGEDLAMRALAKVPKGLSPDKAWEAFVNEFGTRILSRGQMDDIFREFHGAYKTGDVVPLREAVGKKVSQTLMFDYFPGSGSSLTRNPYLRQAIPFYSYSGARNMLMLRSIARGEPVSQMIPAAIFEGVAFAARNKWLGMGLGSELTIFGGAQSYLDYAMNPFEPFYDKDKTKVRAFAELAGGPGVSSIVNTIWEASALAGTVAKMQVSDMEAVQKVALDGGSLPRKDKSTIGDLLNKKAKTHAAQLSSDAYDMLIQSVGLVNYARGAVEGLSDQRVWEGDLKLFDVDWDMQSGEVRRQYDNELTLYQLITYHFIKSSGKPLSDAARDRVNKLYKTKLEAGNSASEQAAMVWESLDKGFRQRLDKGSQGGISRMVRP